MQECMGMLNRCILVAVVLGFEDDVQANGRSLEWQIDLVV